MSDRPLSIAPLLLGAAVLASLGLIGLLSLGSTTRQPAAPSSPPPSTGWTRVAVDPLIPAEVPEPLPLAPQPEAAGVAPSRPARAEVQAPTGLRLSGQVFHADGRAAEGARIVVGRHRERCNAEGRFDFTLPEVPADADLLAFVSGFEPARITGYGARFVAGVEEDHVRLVLGGPSLVIAGQVVDPEGRPRKHWLVELGGEDPLGLAFPREPVRTDEQGRFRVPDVPPGWFPLRVRRAPHDEGILSEVFESGTENARVVTER